MLTTESVLQSVGSRLVADLRTAQRERGLVASGDSAQSLSFTVKRADRTVVLTITGASYWRFQENGRRPNRKKGRPSTWFVNVIREWIKVKNLSIPLAAAGAIAYKIVNSGTKVPNAFNRGGVLSQPLARDRVVGLLKPDLKSHYAQDFTSKLFAA